MSRTDPRPPAIDAVDLVKTYGKGERATRALDGVSFTVDSATVLGLLGPNGAGKSTTVKILTTLARADSGRAVRRRLGRDRAIRRRSTGDRVRLAEAWLRPDRDRPREPRAPGSGPRARPP